MTALARFDRGSFEPASKLFGGRAPSYYRDMQITLNGEAHEIAEPCTVASLLKRFPPAHRGCAVEVNGEVVRRAAHEEHVILDGDVVEIVTLVGGG